MGHTIEARTTGRARGHRLGTAGYVRMLAELRDEAATIRALAGRMDLCVSTAYRNVVSFYRLKVLHVAAWQQGSKGLAYPVFAYGRQADAPAPANAAPIPRSRLIPEAIPLARLIESLAEPTSKREAMECSGMSHALAKTTLGALRSHRLIYIAGWVSREGSGAGPQLPQYLLGDQTDAPPPKPQCRKAINRRYYRRSRNLYDQRRMLVALVAQGA